MKIIFIDVDGVLNSDEAFRVQKTTHTIDAYCMKLFAEVVKATGASIVISSTWRLYDDHRATLMEHFADHGIADRVLGDTPYGGKRFGDKRRGSEIRRWLLENTKAFDDQGNETGDPIFAIIDDDDNAGCSGLKSHFFQTNEPIGLTKEIADKVLNYLNRDNTVG